MPHDPADGCAGCDIWPVAHGPAPAADRDGQDARDPDGDWVARYTRGGVLRAARPCRRCGQSVRLAVTDGIPLHVEPLPLPAAGVRSSWPAFWWHDTWGLTDRVPVGDDRRTAAGELLYVLHPCDHPTPTAPPTRERETRVTAPTFGTPRPPGDGVKNEDLQGKLLLIKVTEKKTGVATSSGAADVVVADIADLTGGEEHLGNFLFGKVLFGQFEVGVTYLGYIGKGVAQPGKSAPWLFTGAETDPAAVAQATQYLNYKASQAPAPAPTPAPAAAPAASPFPPAAAAAPAAAAPWATPPAA